MVMVIYQYYLDSKYISKLKKIIHDVNLEEVLSEVVEEANGLIDLVRLADILLLEPYFLIRKLKLVGLPLIESVLKDQRKNLVNEEYLAGGFLRSELKNNKWFYRFHFKDIFVDGAHKRLKIKDDKVKEYLEKKIIDIQQYEMYCLRLEEYFQDFENLSQMIDREIYLDILKIRREIFKELFDYEEEYIKQQWEKMEYNFSDSLFDEMNKEKWSLILENVLYSDLMIDQSKENRKFVIDDRDIFYENIVQIPGKIAFFPGKREELFLDLKMTQGILSSWEKIANKRGIDFAEYKIYIIVPEERIDGESNYADLINLLKFPAFKRLRRYDQEGQLEIISYPGTIYEFDLKKISESLKRIFEEVLNYQAFVVLKGEDYIAPFENVHFGKYHLALAQNIQTQRYSNLYQVERENEIPGYFAYIPSGVRVGFQTQGIERVRQTLYHFWKTYRKIKEDHVSGKSFKPWSEIKNELEEKKITLTESFYPELLLNPYSKTFDAYLKKKNHEWVEQFISTHRRAKSSKNVTFQEIHKAREKMLEQITLDRLKTFPNGKFIQDFFSFEKKAFKEFEVGKESNGVLVRGVSFGSGVKIKTVFADSFNKSSIFPRNYSDILKKHRPIFVFNLLYFFTNRLKADYNIARSHRLDEKIQLSNFYVGYRGFRDQTGTWHEKFPLYNKGFVGMTKKGEILFGKRELKGGKIFLNDLLISWKKEDVNPIVPDSDKDVYLYTPLYRNEQIRELENKEIETGNEWCDFEHRVGCNRYNLVIVDHQLICIKKGDVLLSCIGIVVSLNKTMFEKMSKHLNLFKGNDDYYYLNDQLEIKIDLDPPENLKEQWNDLEWIAGGGTLLIENGNNMVYNRKMQIENFKEEGWFHPLSKKTQETQVQDWVRGPRMVIGETFDKQIFIISFAGRTQGSKGCRFDEMVYILEESFGKGNLKWVLNLDGGASAGFGIYDEGEYFEITYFASSDQTSAGMVRPINSTGLIQLNQ